MAEEGVFSLKQRYPTMDIERTFGIPQDVLVEIFGENDIKIQVPDINSFLNPEDVGTPKFEQDKLLLQQLINNIRSQKGLTEKPIETYSDAELAEIKQLKEFQAAVEQEKAYIQDPLREKNKAWREKLEADKRNWSTFITGKGTEDQKGIIGKSGEFIKGDMSVDEALNFFGDSFMGIQNTTMKFYPEVNKQNVTIGGDFLSLLPLYFLDRKKLLKGFLDPKSNPVAAGEVAAFAGAGAYTAATAYDGINSIIRELEGLPDPELSNDPRVENLIHSRNAMIFSGGAAALDPVFRMMIGLTRWTYGVQKGSNAEYLAQLAIQQKIPFGIANVTDRSWAKWFGRVVGVFPLIGTDLRANRANIMWYSDKRVMETLNELAPMATVMDAGALLTDAAQQKFNQWSRLNTQLYDDFFARAKALDDSIPIVTDTYGRNIKQGYIPTFRVKQLAKNYVDDLGRGKIDLEFNPNSGVQQLGGFEDLSNFENFLLSMSNLPEYLNAVQFRSLQKQFNQKWGEYASKYGVKQVDDIATQSRHFKKALEQGFNDVNEWRVITGQGGEPDPVILEQMNQVKNSLIRANRVFGFGANTYKSPMAKQFQNVDQNMFVQGGLPMEGWIYDDQLARSIFDTFYSNPSAKALNDLSAIVKRNKADPSKDPINVSARAFMSQLWENSSNAVAYNRKTGSVELGKADLTQRVNIAGGGEFGISFNPKDIVTVNVFDPAKFRANLKLDTQQGQDFMNALWAQTMKGEGKTLGKQGAESAIQNLNQLLKIAEIGYANKIAETSQFVARRAGLAGFSGITGAFLATGAGMSPLTGLGIALLAKKQGQILSNPQYLEWMVKGIDDSLETKIRRANITKLARVLLDDPDNEKVQGLDFDDPEAVMQYMFTNEFTTSSQPEADVDKTFAPNFPQDNPPDMGPVEAGGVENFQKTSSNNMSNELITKPKTNFAASNVSNPFRPVGGSMSPAKRAALASGDLYGAIATAKRGGTINKQGIMYFAGRRRP